MSSVVVGIFPFSIHFLRYLPHLVFQRRQIFSLLPPVSLQQNLHRPQSHPIFDYPASLSVLHLLRISIMPLLTSWQRSVIGEVQKSLLGQCVKSVEISKFFWSAFYCIWTECGDLLCEPPSQPKYGKIQTRKNFAFERMELESERMTLAIISDI